MMFWPSILSGTGWMRNNLHKLPSGWKIWEKAGDKADIPMMNADPAYMLDLGTETSFCYSDAESFPDFEYPAVLSFPAGLDGDVAFTVGCIEFQL